MSQGKQLQLFILTKGVNLEDLPLMQTPIPISTFLLPLIPDLLDYNFSLLCLIPPLPLPVQNAQDRGRQKILSI